MTLALPRPAVRYMVGSAFFFSVMGMLVKLAGAVLVVIGTLLVATTPPARE